MGKWSTIAFSYFFLNNKNPKQKKENVRRRQGYEKIRGKYTKKLA